MPAHEPQTVSIYVQTRYVKEVKRTNSVWVTRETYLALFPYPRLEETLPAGVIHTRPVIVKLFKANRRHV